MQIEKYGSPGVYLVSSNFLKDAKSAAVDWLMPNMRIVTFPSEKWYRLRGTVQELRPLVEAAFNPIVEALTKPLTPEEAKPQKRSAVEYPPVRITGADYEDAVEKFNASFLENKMGDGLPLVPPTREAVARMLKGTSRSPSEVIGKIPMKSGIATIEKIAINAVMAGAKPEYFPVIITAMEAFVAPGYTGMGFWHMMGSAGSFTLTIQVNGPIAKEINMNSGIGFLGDCWRANSTIGRSVRLATRNIGHTWPAENDMALTGRNSPHTFYTFAENEEMSPWDPYQVSHGFAKGDSTVTVTKVGSYGGSGGTMFGGGAVATWTEQGILDGMVKAIGRGRGGYQLWVHPECAQGLSKMGFKSSKDVQDWFAKKTGLPEKNFSISVTGGVPGYSMLWGYETVAHVTKKITGATLTKAGR
jgi:hypothetical protein